MVPAFFSKLNSKASPIATIFGGQPGSGKSQAIGQLIKKFAQQGGCAFIGSDEFRNYHPAYKNLLNQNDQLAAVYTHADASKWLSKAISHANFNKYNIIMETIMRYPDKFARSLQAKGYNVEICVLAVNERLSYLSVMKYNGYKRGMVAQSTQGYA